MISLFIHNIIVEMNIYEKTNDKRQTGGKKLNRKKIHRNNRQNKLLIMLGMLSITIVIALVVVIKIIVKDRGRDNAKDAIEVSAGVEKSIETEESKRIRLLEDADRLAAGYDYDKAISMIKSYNSYETYQELVEAISRYEDEMAVCVPVNIEEITHVFYHSLVVDPDRAFANQESNRQAKGNNQWMTTVDEFNKITQSMYDKGYVLVNLHDIVKQTIDENGAVHFSEGEILLPPGKKPYVLSIDDLSYYHSYDNYGFASKMVLDANGKPKCEYIQADGTTVVGDYDIVPLLDQFLEEHPDGAYRGAKGIIALTGYNGVLGYRTDISYETVPADINKDKLKWLESHPEFNLEEERAKAKEVADAMKADGWSFASHTWGHLKIASISLEQLQADTKRWKENIEPIVGSTDAIIFAHGEDLGDWQDYNQSDAKFQYLKGEGYNFFCNVDSRQYGVQIRDNYVRQTRRNLDGYRIYRNATGQENNLSDLFNAAEIIDSKRPPVAPVN